jgi:hypothetical protein
VHGVSTWITVPASGNIAARSWALQPFMAGPPLPAEWLDSTRVAAIAEALFERRQAAGHPPLFDRILRLEPWRPDDRFAWQVRFFCAGERKRWDLTLVLDAVSGQLVHEEERSA